MSQLTKAQRDELVSKMDTPYCSIKLRCDGHEISVQAGRIGKVGMRFALAVYVDGWFRGEWSDAEQSFPEQKFLKRCEKNLFTPKEKAQLIKIDKACGFSRAQATAWANRKYAYFTQIFPSAKAVVAHLHKVCESIEELPYTP